MISSLLLARRRAAKADPGAVRLTRPVISVGNISMGGRGKTPVAALVAQILVDAGERPAILSRGYGRANPDDGVTVVSDGRGSALAPLEKSGDEPLMLARAVPGAAVLVCEQRALAGTLAESALGCTVHVLDDGFQHHHLRRDIDIVLIAPQDLDARVLPFGPLREPADVLHEASAILIDGDDAVAPRLPRVPFCGALTRQVALPASLPAGARVVAVAGIASPQRFFDTLTQAGVAIAEALPFADHHRFTASDVRRISAAAARANATAIAVTSKDMTKLTEFGGWTVPVVEIPLQVAVEPAAAFREWLLASVATARAARL